MDNRIKLSTEFKTDTPVLPDVKIIDIFISDKKMKSSYALKLLGTWQHSRLRIIDNKKTTLIYGRLYDLLDDLGLYKKGSPMK